MEQGAWSDERLDDRFDGIDRRFDQLDQRFEQVDRRLDRIENEVRDLRIELRGDIAELRTLVFRSNIGMMVGLFGVIAAILARGA